MKKNQIILLATIFILGNYCLYKLKNIVQDEHSITVCGLIVNKYTNNDITQHKHSTSSSVNMYFDIKVGGNFQQRMVSTDLYYKKSVGDNVCLLISVPYNQSPNRKPYDMVYVVVGFVFLCVDIVLLIGFMLLFSYATWNYLGQNDRSFKKFISYFE